MNRTWSIDALERVAWTAVQAAAAIIIASNGFGVEVWKAAGIAAGLALAKAIAAKNIGNSNDASTLPR